MRLLEIIPTPEADPAAIAAVSRFGEHLVGQRHCQRERHAQLHRQPHRHVSVLNVMRVMQEMDFSIEDIDALTGSAVGGRKVQRSERSIL